MSSAIGDIVQNPSVNQGLKKPTDVNLIARALQGFNRGVASLPDMASNLASRAGGYLEGGDQKPLWQIDPVEHFFEKTGIVNPNMPEAQGYAERAIEKGGEIAGGMAIPIGGAAKGLSEGSGAVTSWLAKALLGKNTPSTIGSMVAPAAASPAIDDYTQNPYARAGLDFAASLGGAGAGASTAKLANALMGKPNMVLPEYTAAQQAYMDNPNADRTKTLIARQLDLAKKDPKSADYLDQITRSQEEKIIGNLTPENPISGDEIAAKIKDYTNGLISKRGSKYQTDKAAIMANPNPVDPTPTLSLIDQLKSEAAIGSPLESALNKAQQIILDNSHDPNRVMKAKTSIQNMAKYSPDLHLDSETDAVMKKIANQYGQDIDQAMPGYSEMNKSYSDQTKNLQGIINGLGGKIVSAGETSPTSVTRKIFEKVDPDLSGQIKDVLPSDIYSQAADSYLGDVLQRAQTTPSKNAYNNSTQTYKTGDILNKNYPTLQETLPGDQMAKVDQTLKDIDTTMIGRPRNDYTIDARRGYAVGDEIKGKGSLKDALLNLATKPIRPLQRNEMLTGVSPTGQIVQGAGQIGMRGEVANAMNPPPLTPTPPQFQPQSQQQQVPQQQPYQAPSPQIPTSGGAIDEVMQKYGLGSKQTQPNSQNSSAPQSAIDSVMQKYGVSSQKEQPQANTQDNPNKPRVLSTDEINFLGKALDHDPKSIMDFDENFNRYNDQKRSTNQSGADVFRETLKNNADLLEQSEITGERLNHFVAQLAHESGGFNHLNEIDPSKSNLSDKGGETYKGRGWIQLTGDKNYQHYGDKLGLDLVNNPDLAADPDNAMKIAINYWNDNNLNNLADKDDIQGITQRINGGLNGLEDRQNWLNQIRSGNFDYGNNALTQSDYAYT